MKLDLPSIIIGAVISIITGIIISAWFKSRRRIRALTDHVVAIDPAREKIPTQVTINYGGKAISNLQRFRIGLWNSGNTPVLAEHLINKSAAITIPGHEILDVFGIETSRPEVAANVTEVEAEGCQVSFRLLDETDYINLTIYAEKKDESTGPPKVECGVIGMPKGVKTQRKAEVITTHDAPAFLALVGIMCAIIYLVTPGIIAAERTEVSPIAGWFFEPNKPPFWLVLVEAILTAGFVGVLAITAGAVVIGVVAALVSPIPMAVRSHLGIVKEDKIKRIIETKVSSDRGASDGSPDKAVA